MKNNTRAKALIAEIESIQKRMKTLWLTGVLSDSGHDVVDEEIENRLKILRGEFNVQGTITGRFSAAKPNKSGSPA